MPKRYSRAALVEVLQPRIGYAASLTVRPDHPALLQINPSPFERADFGAAGGKLELQADRQRDDVVFQSFRLQVLQVTEDPHQFIVHDEPSFLAGRVHRDVAARIRAVRAQSPHFGQVEHLAQYAKALVRPVGL